MERIFFSQKLIAHIHYTCNLKNKNLSFLEKLKKSLPFIAQEKFLYKDFHCTNTCAEKQKKNCNSITNWRALSPLYVQANKQRKISSICAL